MTCNPYKGLPLLWLASLMDASELVLLRAFLPRPSFAPIFFQLLLWAVMARWKLPGDVLNAQSEVGGVVGGVIGSCPPVGDGVFALSSVSPSSRSAGSLDDEAELLGSPAQAILSIGKKPDFGDRLESSEVDEGSLWSRSRDRTCLGSCASTLVASSSGGATDARKGPNTESFMSSYTILVASSSADGSGGTSVAGSDNK